MIKSLFEMDVMKRTIIVIMASIVLFAVYLKIDYSNLFNDSEGVIRAVLSNKGNGDILFFNTIFLLFAGLGSIIVMIFMPLGVKRISQKLLLTGIVLVMSFVTYTAAMKTTESESYLISKKENFLNSISNYYSQYSETDAGKEITAYLTKNDYKSIAKMNRKELKYTDILTMTNIVNQNNNPEIKKVYDESMRDSQISLLEKEKLDTLILKKINETI
jgi:hypothetical protein